MKHTLYFESDYCSITLDSEIQALVLTYLRKGSSEEFRSVHHRLLEASAKARRGRLLVDTRNMGAVAPEDQRWVAMQIMPHVAQNAPTQFLYIAVVTPDSVFTKLAVEYMEKLTMEVVPCLNRHFSSMTEARLWLKEQ